MYEPHDTLKPVADKVWIVDGGTIGRVVKMPIRMTVLRLASGGLWLHSPTPAREELVAAVRGLGPVGHIVAPSSGHWMFVEGWQRAFPEAVTWAAPGLRERGAVRRSGVRLDHDLGAAPPPAWAGEIDQVVVPGGGGFREVAFLHRPSRTLVLTDLVVNLEAETLTPATRAFAWATGVLAPNATAPVYLRLVIRMRRAEAAAAAAAMLGWAPERVIISHGRWLDRNATATLRRGLSWLL